jgi:outer membrane receptor protein involved in Fe transport
MKTPLVSTLKGKLSQKATSWGVAFALISGVGILPSQSVYAADELSGIEEVVVTGSRIKRPGAVSTSPIMSIELEEIQFQQETEVEQILRNLPSTIPGDGQNTNNGTAGAATIDLRGLGAQRNLVLVNGRRITPFNQNGQADTSTIPTALIQRIDVVTGGASAVYGSDAIAGAVNIMLRDDFQGFEFSTSKSQTAEGDGDIDNVSLTFGSALDGDRGNVAINLGWTNRESILLGQRDLGQLGINTRSGSGLNEFNAGQAPLESTIAGCTGPGAVDVTGSGSTTSMPTRIAIAGGGGVGQFLNDRSVFTGDAGGGAGQGCSLFNFNPFNYYRTPQEKYNVFAIADFELNDHFKPYTQIEYSNITVIQQIAPSGTFGQTFDVPLANPFFSDQARAATIAQANTAIGLGNLTAGGSGANWNDVNANGLVDVDDYLKLQLRRRTLELGPRSEKFDNEHFMVVAGATGDIINDWTYDVSYQYGESNRTTIRDGYTNLTNIATALDTTSTTTCTNSSDATCVPIDLFGGFGTITPAMAGYARAIALQQQKYEQSVFNVSATGSIDAIQLPTANSPMQISVGFEKRDEFASLTPDECLKLAPASCQGGAGGNLLPISGGFNVNELFFEGFLPLVEGMPGIESLGLEVGYRTSDYSTVGSNDTYKIGLNWQPMDSLMFRVMQQEATRAPNVGELFSPVTTGLDNATGDPCSIANAGNIDATLAALCVSTGMLAGQVGTTQDIVSGQINVLAGSDPINLPAAETASTLTVGFVWTPEVDMLPGLSLSVDYYDIDIEDVIGTFSAQETLDACYILGQASACGNVNRVDGDLTSPSSGVQLYTTNLVYLQAEGIEVGFGFGLDLADFGDLQISGMLNKYLTNESQSSPTVPVIDCVGKFGNSCSPLAEMSWNTRATWTLNDATVSLSYRWLDSIDIEDSQRSATFDAFETIDSIIYVDLYGGYSLMDDKVTLSFGVDNLFDIAPPVVGNDAGSTSDNGGNTFPSFYDAIGRTYTAGVRYAM